ncbi:hypothetical protein SprV_0902721700 [Sparganum proliferum]
MSYPKSAKIPINCVDENSPFEHSSPSLPIVPNQATICGLFDGPASPCEPSLRGNSRCSLAVASENPQNSVLLTPKVSPPLSSSGSEMRLWSKTHGRFWLSRTISHRIAQSSSRQQQQPVPLPPIGRFDPQTPSTPLSGKWKNNASHPNPSSGSSGDRRRSARLLAKTSPAPTSSTPPDSERQLGSVTHGTFWPSRTALHRTAQSARGRRQLVPPPSIGRLDIEAPSTPISTKKDPLGGVRKSPEGSDRRRSARLVARVSPAQSLHTPPAPPPPATEKKLWSETYGTFWLSRTAAHRSAQRSNYQGQQTRPSPRPLGDPEVPTAHTPVRGTKQSHPQSANPTPVDRKQGAGRPNDPPPPSGPLSSTTARTPLKCLWINGNLRAPSTTHAAGLSTKPKPPSTPVPKKSALRSRKPATDAPAEQVKRTVTFDTQLRTPLSGAFKTSRIPMPKNGGPPLGKPRP